MPCAFSYRHASKHSHKMASKYSFYQNDVENLTISNGWEKNWVSMTKNELMTIPWMRAAIEGTNAKLFIDDCLGFDIQGVSEAGAIYLKQRDVETGQSHLRISKNIKTPSRFLLTEYYRPKGGVCYADPNYPREIHSATVSANFGTLSDGFRVFTDGEKKYLYTKDGEEYLACDDYDDDSCCGYDYGYEWD